MRFGEEMTKNYRENQKLLYGTSKQLKQKKVYNMKNIKHKDGITDGKMNMEEWRQHFEELANLKMVENQ